MANTWRSADDFDEWMRMDLEYVDQWVARARSADSPGDDTVVLRGKGAS